MPEEDTKNIEETKGAPEEKPEEATEKERSEKTPPEKKSWLKKIPPNVLLSPGGMVLIIFALFMEIIDLIPIPFVDQLWELPLEIIFIILLAIIAKVPIKNSIVPFLIERAPILSDILPTWILRMLA